MAQIQKENLLPLYVGDTAGYVRIVGADGISYRYSIQALIDLAAEDPAIAGKIGDLDNLTTEDKTSLVAAINEVASSGGGGTGLSDDVKQALLQIAEKAVYVDDGGAQYYQDLYDALYPPASTFTVTNTLIGCTTNNSATAITENAPYSATITASSGYSLTGATVSITMDGTDITSTAYNNGAISIASVTGNLIITVTAVAVTLSSISAVYTQSGTVYDTDTLDSLKADLIVTATWSDTTTTTIDSADYTLSGTLTAGTSTVTVTYSGFTTTFSVSVTQDTRPWKTLSISDDFVEGTAWGSSYNSTYGQYCTANTSRCSYGKFEFYLEAGYKYTFEHDSSNSSQKFGIVSGEKTTTTTTAIENHSSLSNKMPSDSGWQASGYTMTPSVDTYVAIQFNVTATALQNSGCTELRIRKVAV